LATIPILCNETAGSAGGVRARLLSAFAGTGVAIELRAVPPHEIAEAVREESRRGVEVVGVSGGDGTLSSAAGAVVESGIAMAVFPGGTLNHFAATLGVLDCDSAVHALLAGSPARVDVGEVNGRIFLNGLSLGLYPRQLRIRRRWRPLLGKWPAAGLAGAVSLGTFGRHRLLVESPALSSQVLSPLVWVGVGRGTFQRPTPGQRDVAAGVLEMVVVSARSRLRMTRLAARALRKGGDGLSVCRTEKDCTVHRAEHFTVRGVEEGELDAGIDGELARLTSPVRLRVLPGALRTFLGPEHPST
jgi:diacylglycerol kinase family enzyme